MSQQDRERWNRRWAERAAPGEPSPWVRAVCTRWLPVHGRALDVAGGAGRHSALLARHGLDVTLSDISDIGARIFEGLGLPARIDLRDLEVDGLTPGPWDVVLDYHFLHRPLFPQVRRELADGGIFVFCQPTLRNLERHDHPSAQHLLAEGEILDLLGDLEILEHDEGWNEEGRHEARIVARRGDE